MTKQLILLNSKPTPSASVSRLDERTKELGRIGIREARAALSEANRRVAEREALRTAMRDNELADRARTARRAALTLTQGTSDSPVAPSASPQESSDHQSAA
ncbi:MAG TPA: hypothetical protein VL068_07910 [Microthrixaceae bacterium]|nr:hypothetical protein [Microthrixaceae bacterium]